MLVSRLGGNIVSLYAVQGLNYLLPLAVLPYLLRVLGPRGYGGIAFAQSLMAYAVILTDFGFNFSATRAVSLARDEPGELARIFWTTLAAKGVLLLCAAAVICAAVVVFPILRVHAAVIGVCGLAVVGTVLLPQWYFQGIERMRPMAWIQAGSRFLVLAPVFILVRSAGDDLLAAALLSVPALLGGLVCLLSVGYIAPLGFYRPRWIDVRRAFAGSRDLFISNAATTAYVTSNAFILGIVSGDRAVALYSLANKAALAAFGLLSPVVQAVFPRASLLFGRSLDEAKSFVRRMSVPVFAMAALISVVLLVFAGPIVRLLGGAQYRGAVPVLRVMAVLPLALAAATLLAQIVMINLGLARSLSRIYVAMGVLNLVVLPILASRLGALGAAWALLGVETLGPIVMIGVIRRTRFFQTSPA